MLEVRNIQAKLADPDYRSFRSETIRRGVTVQMALSEAITLWIAAKPEEPQQEPAPAWRGILSGHSTSLADELIAERRAEASRE